MTEENNRSFAQRMLGAVDLAIDFATLGEYGLEPLPEDRTCRERPGRRAGWEALATLRPDDCGKRRRRARDTERSRPRAHQPLAEQR